MGENGKLMLVNKLTVIVNGKSRYHGFYKKDKYGKERLLRVFGSQSIRTCHPIWVLQQLSKILKVKEIESHKSYILTDKTALRIALFFGYLDNFWKVRNFVATAKRFIHRDKIIKEAREMMEQKKIVETPKPKRSVNTREVKRFISYGEKQKIAYPDGLIVEGIMRNEGGIAILEPSKYGRAALLFDLKDICNKNIIDLKSVDNVTLPHTKEGFIVLEQIRGGRLKNLKEVKIFQAS